MRNVKSEDQIPRIGSESQEAYEMKKLLFKIGKKLRYEVDIEEEPVTELGKIGIRYDVIWYVRCPEWYKALIRNALRRNNLNEKYRRILERKFEVERWPIAAFEIEASDRATKFMKGDIFNLTLVPFGVCVVLLGKREAKEMKKKEHIRNRFEKALVEFRKVFGINNVIIVSFSDVKEYARKLGLLK